jgi:hypothetical protein
MLLPLVSSYFVVIPKSISLVAGSDVVQLTSAELVPILLTPIFEISGAEVSLAGGGVGDGLGVGCGFGAGLGFGLLEGAGLGVGVGDGLGEGLGDGVGAGGGGGGGGGGAGTV